MSNSFVWASGPKDAEVLLLSQGPGRAEGQIGKPFVGPSGEQQQMYLSFFGLDQRRFYLTNLMKEWRPENPKPTEEDILRWEPVVKQEIQDVNPRIIAAVGGIAARWLLKPYYPDVDLSMDMIHGLAFRLPENRIAIAIEHPASGLHSPRQKASIFYDYSQLNKAIRGESLRWIGCDPYRRKEIYEDVSGFELIERLSEHVQTDGTCPIAIDTEGSLKHKDLWSVQFSRKVGTGFTLRNGTKDFDLAIRYIQNLVNAGVLIVVHNALFDIPMCRLAGLELERARLFDTMYALFTLGGYERQGLDYAGFRFCGRVTDKFMGLVGDSARQKQIDYLNRAAGIDWGKPEPRKVVYNDGMIKLYKPGGMNAKIERILKDIKSGKTDKDGNLVDPEDRFYRAGSQQFHKDLSGEMIAEVEYALGLFPYPSLDDVPLDQAIKYASRDADVTLDLYYALMEYPDFINTESYQAFESGMKTLTAVEECQRTGVPRNRRYFIDLKLDFETQASEIQWKIANEYFDGKPYNPRSHVQTRELLEKLGETGLEKTKVTKEISTSEDSILHLQGKHDAIRDHFHAKHMMHLAGSFCRPPIERGDPKKNIDFVHSKWINTSIPSRRLATSGKDRKSESGFNLLNQPSRGSDSLLIRKGYECPEGYCFVSADLSQIEPRVLTHFSQEPRLLDIYLNDRDWYRETGALMQGIPGEEVTSEERRGWKVFDLALLYGSGGFTLMKQFFKSGVFWVPVSALGADIEKIDETDFSEDETKVRITDFVSDILINRWYRLHPGVVDFKDSLAEEVFETGIIRDASGMPRIIPDIRSFDKRDRAQAERWIVSHKVQGTAQTIIQNSMAALIRKFHSLRDKGMNIWLCMQYHDELISICPIHLAHQVGALIVWAMTTQHGFELSVPIKAEYCVGKTWAELKD